MAEDPEVLLARVVSAGVAVLPGQAGDSQPSSPVVRPPPSRSPAPEALRTATVAAIVRIHLAMTMHLIVM
jgi:hypothetical protein